MTKTSSDKNARDRVGTAGTGRRAECLSCVAVIIVSQRGTKSSLFFRDLGENVYGTYTGDAKVHTFRVSRVPFSPQNARKGGGDLRV